MSISSCDNVINNTMTTSTNSTEFNDFTSASTRNAKVPAIPKRPTIIRVDKRNAQETADEPKSKEVPKVPPRPPPPKRCPPPVPAKQPVAQKPPEVDKKKKKPEITIVNARPMSEICFRDHKPEIPVPPRPQKLKVQGEVSSNPNLTCAKSALTTEPSNQTQPPVTLVRCKSSTLPPQRPRLPPAKVTKKIPPRRPSPPKLPLPASIEASSTHKTPACVQLENVQPPSDPTDFSSNLLNQQSSSTSKLVTPPKPRPRTYFDASAKPPKPVVVQRSASAYKPTKNVIPPRPLPRKSIPSSTVDPDVSEKTIDEIIPPPKPSRHQSFRSSFSPSYPVTCPYSSFFPSWSQEESSELPPVTPPLSSVFTTDEQVSDAIISVTEEAPPADKTNTLSSETPESFNVENESSSTDETVPCLLPPKKNSLVISQPSIKCSSEEVSPVPSPRVKHSSKPDTPASTPIDPVSNVIGASSSTHAGTNPVPIVSEELKDFAPPSETEILVRPATVRPTIIRASKSVESLQEPKLTADSAEKQIINRPESSGKPPSEDTIQNLDQKDPETKKAHRVPPPIPKKNPISANICDRNVTNVNSNKSATQPTIPSKPPKPCPPTVAQMPVKNKQKSPEAKPKQPEAKQNQPEAKPSPPEAKADGGGSSSSSSISSGSGGSGGSNLIKNLIFSKKSSSPASSSTDLKKPSSAKSRKAADMLQTTKDYTRRFTKSLGFTTAEEPTTVWYTDQAEDEPEEKSGSFNKKNENPPIWYIDEDPEEEEISIKKAPIDADETTEPEKPLVVPVDKPRQEVDYILSQSTGEPELQSPTEISAFQKYHSYMKRTIEEAVGIQLRQSSSSLIDESINEEKEGPEPVVIKPQPVKPPVPDLPKKRPSIPPKLEIHPNPKPSAPPRVKSNVSAVPPKRPPAPALKTQSSTKPEGSAVRPPPPRPKPVVSVKPIITDNQNTTNDPKSKFEERSPSIENLIVKFEEELCKKAVPPPRPAPPTNRPKMVKKKDNQEPKLSTANKETVPSADSDRKTNVPTNATVKSNIRPDENENLSISAAEVGKNKAATEKNATSNLTADSLVDENANEEADNEPGKRKDTNPVSNVNVELRTEKTAMTETKEVLHHKVGYSDSFNQRCKSLMDDLKIRFDNEEEKDVTDEKIKKEVEPGRESLNNIDASSDEESEEKELLDVELLSSEEKELDEKFDLSSSEERELDEKVNLPNSEEKKVDEKVDLSNSEEKKVDKKIDLSVSEEKKSSEKIDLSSSENIVTSRSEEKELNEKINLSSSEKENMNEKVDHLSSQEKKLNEKIDFPISEEKTVTEKIGLSVSEEKELDKQIDHPNSEEKELNEKVVGPSTEEKLSDEPSVEALTVEVSEKTSQENSMSQIVAKEDGGRKSGMSSQKEATLKELDPKDTAPKENVPSSHTSELTGPRAIVNFDFEVQEKDELMLKKDDVVQLFSWVDTSWLYGTCHGKTGIFPLAFVRIIEPLPQSPSDADTEVTDVSVDLKTVADTMKLSSVEMQENSTRAMGEAYHSVSEIRTASASAPEPATEAELLCISVEKENASRSTASTKDDADDEELTDSDQLDKINIPVGGEETIAYALYDFEGEDGELSFKEGNEITILKWVNEDWLLGKKDGSVGNLPANYVNFMGDSTDDLDLDTEVGPPEPKGPPPPLQPDVKTDQLLTYVAAQLEHVKRLKGFACARFDFEARDEDELSFKDGDRIEILEFVSDDWIRGSLHKKEGIFPATFVSVEEYSPDEEKRSSETTKVRALHDFISSASDDLSFKAGALITRHGDVPNLPGWSKGSFEGRTGVFPSDFVTREGI